MWWHHSVSPPSFEVADCDPLSFREWLTAKDQSGLPHIVTENDTYEGYFIPKGSTVIVNIW